EPKDNNGRLISALAYIRMGEYTQAANEIGQVKELDKSPPSPDSYLNLLNTGYLQVGDFRNSIKTINKVIDLNPDSIDPYVLRAMANYSYGNFDKAISDCSHVLSLNPSDDQALLQRGLAYAAKKDYKKALSDYDDFVNHNLEIFIGYFYRANCLKEMG